MILHYYGYITKETLEKHPWESGDKKICVAWLYDFSILILLAKAYVQARREIYENNKHKFHGYDEKNII